MDYKANEASSKDRFAGVEEVQGEWAIIGNKQGEVVTDLETSVVPSRHKKPPPHPTRAGKVSCLRCGEKFDSWDRTRNRICSLCANRK